MSGNIIEKIFQPSARAKVWRFFAMILILVFVGGLIDGGSYYNRGADWVSMKTGEKVNLPKTKEIPFKLGLDLQGGTHLVYQADMSAIEAQDQVDAIEGVRDVIERRVNKFGVSEPLVQTNMSGSNYRVIVELAGIKDVKEAIAMIGETPLLEFKEESDEPMELSEAEIKLLAEFNIEASAEAEEVFKKIGEGANFADLAGEYASSQELKDSKGDLDWITERSDMNTFAVVKDFEVGQVTDELKKGDFGYAFYQLEDKRTKKNLFDDGNEKEVKASHLLICYKGADKCESEITKEEAYEKISVLREKATVASFSKLIKENSTEPGADTNAGELGWFVREMMVDEFSDVVFTQEIGTLSDVVETKFGYHIIKKESERDIEEYKVRAIFIRTITAQDILGGKKNWKNTELTGKYLERALVQFNPNDNTPEVGLQFDGEGGDFFADITERNIDKPVAIFLDGEIISMPTVNSKITGGKAVISGGFGIKEAKLLAQRLNAGALPVPIDLISQQTVGASLGQSSLSSSMKAGMIGLILVALFMILYYRLPGLLAVVSLCIYGLLILAVFKIWPVTLTLSGLAGFILSIGMAVDANVLIFERLREELRDGTPLSIAVEKAFSRAWPSIRDGNFSTLITCMVLIQFSTGIVKGFAVTLGLGVLVSMFSAIVITKTFLQLVSGDWLERNKWMIGVPKK